MPNPTPQYAVESSSTPLAALGSRAARDLWTDPGTFGTTLLILAMDRWPPAQPGEEPEFLGWHPAALRLQIRDDFVAEPAQANLDRLLAAITILKSDDFYRRLNVFNELCLVLSGDDFQPGIFRPADCSDCAWGITEAMLLHPPDDQDPFDEEIRRYLGMRLQEEGLLNPPDVLRLAIMPERQDSDSSGEDTGLDAAILQEQQSKSQDIVEMIRTGLGKLLDQVRILPLTNGTVEQIQARLVATLRRDGAGNKE